MPAPIVAEDLYRFRWIDHVRLSPDGERVAYQIGWADPEVRQNRSRIVIRRLLEPEPVEVTAGPRRDHSPEWSRDGNRIAFVSRRGAADQVFVLDLSETGEALQVTSMPEGAGSPAWSPDGTKIAFIAAVLSDPDGVVDDPRPPENREQLRRAPVARIARRLDYKHDGQGYVDGRYHHLFVVSAAGGDVTQLTSGTWDVTGFDWSPDGTKLVVAGNAEPNADVQRALNLYLVDLAGRRSKLVGGFYLGFPSWSPRGDQIAFVAPNGLDAGLMERLWIVPSTGGDQRCLTIGLDQGVGDSLITDMRAGHSTRLAWSAEGDRLYFQSSGPGVSGVYSCDLQGNVRPEVGGQRRVYDFDVGSGVIAFCASDVNHPGELHMVTEGAEARITDLNPWLRERYVAQPERESFMAPDGWVVEGWMLRPDNFDPARRYPLILEIHGGPHGQYGWAFVHEMQVLAGMGYIVLYVNPRGSDGYGEHFRRQVVRDWGGKDYLDLMAALDQTIERTDSVDVSRMGIGGGSYGGYMTNWAIGQTNRFSAAVAMRSISNLVSEYAQHDVVLWGALELGPPPWPDLDELWRRSPIRYVQNIQTPLLLTCGEMDLRCAISQSEELFGAMRFLGKTVEMVRFPEESHDLSRTGRPDRRVERLKRIAAWFERFLGTASTEKVADADTQVLPVPHMDEAAAAGEAAPTTVLETIHMEAATEVIRTTVLEEQPTEVEAAAAETPVAEAEPAPMSEREPEPEPEPEPVPELVAHEAEAVAEPVPEAADSADTGDTLVEEPFPVEADAAPVFPEPEPVFPEPAPIEESAPAPSEEPEAPPASSEPWVVTQAPEPRVAEPEPEPWAATQVPEPAVAEPEPEPWAATQVPEHSAVQLSPEPWTATQVPAPAVMEPESESAAVPAPEPEPEPEAVTAEPEPELEPVVAASEPPPPNPSVTSTMLRWPTSSSIPELQENGKSETGEAATSIIPAWQPAEIPSESKRTVSLQAMPPESIAAGEPFLAKLSFESGPFAGRVVALPSQMVTVGRAPDNDLVVGDPATSGRHGRIEMRAGAFWISDLGSTNGTLVNGEPVIERQLSDGDLIAIGQNTIRFTLEE
ncbi:MAG TPA: prolyl oligopeptidase family serine peptidase [Candidatus Dormibacteraeota bacterium]|nr:prolyl oligopeptidase family serine peptidase [Candidatus Dormibacteraeota bacterium]